MRIWRAVLSAVAAFICAASVASVAVAEAMKPATPSKAVSLPEWVGEADVAKINARLLSSQLRGFRVQEMLIGSGNLDKEAGHVSQPVLFSAANEFRQAIGSSAKGPLSEDELRRLEDASDAFLSFADYVRVTDPDTRITITLPRNLFGVTPRTKTDPDPNWSTYVSSYGGMQIHVFRYPLLAETPVSLVSRLVERRQNVNFERFEVTGNEFAVDATADYGSGKSYILAIRGWETNGVIIGFQAVFDLDYSAALQVPDLLVPEQSKTTFYPNGRASNRTVQVSAREGNWRRVIKALVNRIGSDFETSNGWSVLSSGDCRKRPTSGRGGKTAPRVVRVVYATDRKPVPAAADTPPNAALEVDRLYGHEPDDNLHIGCAIISVPYDQTAAAKIQRPRPTARGQTEKFDPKKHFALDSFLRFGSASKLGRGEELTLIDEGREGSYERALLLIHGYNTSFAEALLRIAQIAAAVDEDLRVYLFSWPSRERYIGYIDDMDNAERAERTLQYFMRLILRDANVRQLDVIAHSMGSQSLLRSIDGLKQVFDQRAWVATPAASGDQARAAQVRLRLGQVIFAAPDVSRPIFERQLASLAPYARRVTIYTSGVDRALWLSEKLRWSPRAGYLGTTKEPIRAPASNVHVIDVTGKPLPKLSPKRLTEFNHNYFVENPAVLADINSILKDSASTNPSIRSRRTKGKVDHSFVEVPYQGVPDAVYWRLVDAPAR